MKRALTFSKCTYIRSYLLWFMLFFWQSFFQSGTCVYIRLDESAKTWETPTPVNRQHLHKQHLHTGMLPMLIKIWLYLWDGHIIKLLLNTVLFTAPRGYFFLWELSVGPKTKHKEHALSHPMGLKSNILPQRQISNLALFYVSTGMQFHRIYARKIK